MRLDRPLVPGLLGEAKLVLRASFEIMFFVVDHQRGNLRSLRDQHNGEAARRVPEKLLNFV
jgi:hypothetical protein